MNRVEIGLLAGGVLAASAWAGGMPGSMVGGLVGLVAVGVAAGAAEPGLGWFGPARTHVSERGIALTIDDGPDPATTPRILAALATAHSHATFFFLADRARAHPELVAATIEAGHEVGLHGLTHSSVLTVLGPRRGEAWVRAGVAALEGAGSGPITRFRPPFGVVSPRLVASVRAAGLELVWCSIRTRDGVSITEATLTARLRRARPGDIVLLHDGNPVTANVLPSALAGWAGMRVGSVAELA